MTAQSSDLPRRVRACGFALAMVLWVIAGLSVIAAAANQNASLVATATKTFSDRALAEREFAKARAQLLYTLATSGVTQQGRRIGDKTMIVDDTPYAMAESHFVSIQDARGLLNLNSLRAADGVALLRSCGVERDEQAHALVDALADYVDADDLKRLNGAEALDYSAQQSLPPANRALLSVGEVWRVLGWNKIKTDWEQRGCNDWVDVSDESGFNYISAPETVLKIKGFEASVAQALVSERRANNGQVSVLANNVASFSLSSNPFSMSMMARPGNTYRVRHWHTNGASLQYTVVLPSSVAEPPWVILDPVWSWDSAFAQRRSSNPFPLRTPTDLTEDARATTPASPFQ